MIIKVLVQTLHCLLFICTPSRNSNPVFKPRCITFSDVGEGVSDVAHSRMIQSAGRKSTTSRVRHFSGSILSPSLTTIELKANFTSLNYVLISKTALLRHQPHKRVVRTNVMYVKCLITKFNKWHVPFLIPETWLCLLLLWV